MISITRKYSSVEDFILNSDKYRIEKFSLVMNVCSAVKEQDSEYVIDNTCFYCNYCNFGNLIGAYQKKFNEIRNEFPSSIFFNKQIITLPSSKFFINNRKNKDLYTFTSIEETKRIQLWATSILANSSNQDVVTAIEIPAPNELFDRNGRIDIGAKSKDNFLFIETKTTLQDAMNDERFVEQHSKYAPTIQKLLPLNKFSLFILIGGREIELHPPGSIYNQTDIGDLSKRFYKLVGNNSNRIPFISAAALWGLSIKFMEDKSFDMIEFLNSLFMDKNTYGLVSSGKIIKTKDGFEVEKIKL